jgi:hypothetical protein
MPVVKKLIFKQANLMFSEPTVMEIMYKSGSLNTVITNNSY